MMALGFGERASSEDDIAINELKMKIKREKQMDRMSIAGALEKERRGQRRDWLKRVNKLVLRRHMRRPCRDAHFDDEWNIYYEPCG